MTVDEQETKIPHENRQMDRMTLIQTNGQQDIHTDKVNYIKAPPYCKHHHAAVDLTVDEQETLTHLHSQLTSKVTEGPGGRIIVRF